MILAITNRRICRTDLTEQIRLIAGASPDAVLLREKDLPVKEYSELARRCLLVCKEYGVPLVLHHFIGTARELGIQNIHLPFVDFTKYKNELNGFYHVGVSVHSVEEAVYAEKNAASYLICGHIFKTSCKEGLPPRGLSFLSDVCSAVDIPVFAIGGISQDKVPDIMGAGAKGVCLMSSLMQSHSPDREITIVKQRAKPRHNPFIY